MLKKIVLLIIFVGLVIMATVVIKRDIQSANIELKSSKVEKVILKSQVLDMEMKLCVYLPKGYNKKVKYPVLYLLHGYGGTEETWFSNLNIAATADKMIDRKTIKPLIIVAPLIDNSYGINSSKISRTFGGDNRAANGHEGMYEDYIYKELVTYIDENYSTINSREGRYIGGLSMGGYAALHIGFKHNDVYSKVGGHSPGLFLEEFPNIILKNWLYPNNEVRKERDPLLIAQEKDLSNVAVYLDCGNNDSYKFYKGCEALNSILESKGVRVQYHLYPGGHDVAYWSSHIEEYLTFYAGN